MGIYIDGASKAEACEYCRFFGSRGGFEYRGERYLNGCYCLAMGKVGQNVGPSVGGRAACVKVGSRWLNPKCPVEEAEMAAEE